MTVAEAARLLNLPPTTVQDAVVRMKLSLAKGHPGRRPIAWAQEVDWHRTDAELARSTDKTIETVRSVRCRVARGDIEAPKHVAAAARTGVRKRRRTKKS